VLALGNLLRQRRLRLLQLFPAFRQPCPGAGELALEAGLGLDQRLLIGVVLVEHRLGLAKLLLGLCQLGTHTGELALERCIAQACGGLRGQLAVLDPALTSGAVAYVAEIAYLAEYFERGARQDLVHHWTFVVRTSTKIDEHLIAHVSGFGEHRQCCQKEC
jgi:hypothetical protein